MPGQPRRSVSHVIVLFDFIEEMYEKGEPFIEAVLDAGIERLRPVMHPRRYGVGTFPSFHPRRPAVGTVVCYAQIGGLSVATFIELLLVPVLYGIFVLDLRLIKWDLPETHPQPQAAGRIREVSVAGKN